MSTVTMVTPLRNGLYSTILMRESFLAHHERIPWIVCDDASTDGVTNYVKDNADQLIINSRQLHFGQSLDAVCNAVNTPYTLTVDNDVEFLGPILPDMLNALGDHLCVATTFQAGSLQFHDFSLKGQRKIDHSCALWNTEKLQHVLKYFSFEAYMNCMKLEYYDGGAMVYRAAMVLNHKINELTKIWEQAIHFGGVSVLFCENVSNDPEENIRMKANYAKKYDVIKNRLNALRNNKQTKDGLTWVPAHDGICSHWSCLY